MKRLLGSAVAAGAIALAATLSLVAPAHGTATQYPRDPLPKRAVLATARARVPVYHRPGARSAFLHYTASNGYGQPRVFLVANRVAGWEEVYLPKRPNGSTGWVRDRSVTLTYDPYTVIVSLGRHMVWVYDDGRPLLATKAGVGRSITSTPTGTYFLVMLLKQPNPNGVYGPYAFGTSAFSSVYYHFGGGPGEIGLHGTDDPAGLGTNVSHGCIRISNAAITRLAKLLPLGTPVVITK
jgi:lipoprotein-anchoring transpeptidase ErfK/SrfK